MLQHVIIAGVNKCGTTSLFRYLSDHPEICASSVKETQFFQEYVTEESDLTYDNYRRFFPDCDATTAAAIEASPSYFTSGGSVAARIASVVPDVKLIIMLRDPVERLHSYFKSAQAYDNYATPFLEGYSFDEFVREAIDATHDRAGQDEKTTEFVRALRQGDYAAHSNKFHAVFADSQIHYIMFEEFCREPGLVLRNLCAFLGISHEFYKDFDFTVENKSRHYKSRRLQRLAFRINMRFEGFLNRYPSLRRLIRSAYVRLNEERTKRGASISEESREALRDYYSNSHQQLTRFLAERYAAIELPGWSKSTL
jgi:hypothetical protein